MTQETLYMVAEIGYEYNDEVYHRGESDSIIPVVLYRDQQKAEAVAAQKTLDHLRSEELFNYAYSLEDMMSYDNRRNKAQKRALEDLINKYDPDFDMNEAKGWEAMETVDAVVKKMTDDDIVAFLAFTNLAFFEVREVVLED
jgi:hypothetical protein